jgi:DNA-binding winged helix-turn-helix (wHTH) protein
MARLTGSSAVLSRDEVKILLALCQDPERIVPHWRIVPNVWNVFIRVGVQDPDGHDIAIAQPIEDRS